MRTCPVEYLLGCPWHLCCGLYSRRDEFIVPGAQVTKTCLDSSAHEMEREKRAGVA